MDIEELGLYEKEVLPERIYHYTSMDNFYKIVSGKSLFLFGISNLNDYKERTVVIEVYNEIFLRNELEIPRPYLLELSTYMERRYDQITSYVFCMSGLYDSLSQWRAYGDDGNGVCLVFNTTKMNIKYSLPSILWSTNEDKMVLHNIIYSKEEQVNIISKIINTFYHRISKTSENEEIKRSKFAELAGTNIMRFGSIFKTKEFQEEKEWRIIYSPLIMCSPSGMVITTDANDKIGFINSRNNIKSYFPLKGEILHSIDKILLGPKNISYQFDMGAFLQTKGFLNCDERELVTQGKIPPSIPIEKSKVSLR